MPLAKIHVVEGRYTEDRLAKVSGAIQAALINTLRIPPDDFYQLIFELPNKRYLDDVDELVAKNSAASDFFNAMLRRYPNRLGATTLWAGTNSLYAPRDPHDGEVLPDSMARWFKP